MSLRLELVWNGRTRGSRTIFRSICSIRMGCSFFAVPFTRNNTLEIGAGVC